LITHAFDDRGYKEEFNITAVEGRSRDFYGEAAEKYGVNNNKRDGALMAQGVDWKNAYHKPIDAEPNIKT
jgi:hypothetical protein